MKRKSILVMEDEIPLLNAIRIKLERKGFNTIPARTVRQALEYLKLKIEIDLIWLDHYLLGDKSGLDFVNIIKNMENPWKNIPIFVVSNTASPEKIQNYLTLGIKRYYAKSDHRLDDIIKEIE